METYPLAEAPDRRDAIVAADIVVIWRAAWCAEVVGIIDAARQSGAKLVFDVDDLMVEPDLASIHLIDGIRTQFIPESAVRGHYARVRDTMANCDFCIASTDELAWYMRGHAKTTFVLPNGFDTAVLHRARLAARRRRHTPGDGLFRIGYAAGSRTHQQDFAAAAPAVARTLQASPHARLVLFTSPVDGLPVVDIAEFPEFAGLEAQIEWRVLVPLEDLPGEMARFDVSLAPLQTGNPFCEAKSELKYFEAALADVVTIASPTGPFRRVITPGRTGFLADSEAAWFDALRRAIDEPALLRRMARAARRDVLWRFGPERQAEQMAAILDQIQGGPAMARAFALETARAAMQRRDPLVPPGEIVFEQDSFGHAEVTVIVPLYNYEHHVIEALDSVAAQTLAALHLVIVDDCSTDQSLSVALGWAKRNASRFGRIAVLRNTANAGLGPTRNAGFDAAETAYVLPLDADNRLRPACCERLLAAAQRSGAAFVYPLIREFGDSGKLMGSLPYAPQRLVGVPYIDAMALVSVAAWSAAGGYWDGRLGWEDYEFWCRLAELGLTGLQAGDEELADYRVHRGSMLQSVTEARQNKPLVMAQMHQLHPWLSIIYARQTAPVPVAAAHLGTLEALLPLLRCPVTGLALLLDRQAGVLRSEDGTQSWPVIDGKPLLIPGAEAVPVLAAPHNPDKLPEAALALMREAAGPVLHLNGGGAVAPFGHVIEAGAALFPGTHLAADALHLPFASQSLAGIVALGGLEHYANPAAVAAEFYRVLQPGGRLLLRTALLQPAAQDLLRATAAGLQGWFAAFETEALHVAEGQGPAEALAQLTHAAEAALGRDLSPATAAAFALMPVGRLAALWTDHAARDGEPGWLALTALPQAAQQQLAAGYEAIFRRPAA